MEFTEKVLITSLGRFREADLWVRFLSPSRGQLTAFAFGGCKSRKRFCGCLDVLNQVRFHVKSDRGGRYLSLMEGSLAASPSRLRNDWERFGMAMNCVRFYEAVGCGADCEPDAYALLVSSLETLDRIESASSFFPTLFRTRLLQDLGVAPETGACAECGRELGSESRVRLAVDRGHFLCNACSGRTRDGVGMGAGSFGLWRSIHNHEPARWEALLPDPDDRRELSRAMERYTRFHLGISWDRGRFRRV